MTTKELQEKYNRLKSELESSKLNKARAQANFETAERERDTALNKLLEITDSKNYEEAKQKFSNLEAKLEAMLKEAEELLK